MFIPKDSGHTCTSRSGRLKKKFDTDKEAIETAKYYNEKNHSSRTKQVAFKCPNCHKYHLTSKPKKIK